MVHPQPLHRAHSERQARRQHRHPRPRVDRRREQDEQDERDPHGAAATPAPRPYRTLGSGRPRHCDERYDRRHESAVRRRSSICHPARDYRGRDAGHRASSPCCRSLPWSPPAGAAAAASTRTRLSRLHGRWRSTQPASGSRLSVPVSGGSGLPDRIAARRGRASLDLAIPLRLARRQSQAGAGDAPERASTCRSCRCRTTIALRPVRQVLHNDCEATALSMLLAAAGVHVGQLRLQARLPRSGPLDPEPVAGSRALPLGRSRAWLRRAAGGRRNGGRLRRLRAAVRALAARYGVHLVDLHGRSVAVVRARRARRASGPRLGRPRRWAVPAAG